MTTGLAEVADDNQARLLVKGEDRGGTPAAGLRVAGDPHQAGLGQHSEALDDGRAGDAQPLGKFVAGRGLPGTDQGEYRSC